jgi:hypothetical protein
VFDKYLGIEVVEDAQLIVATDRREHGTDLWIAKGSVQVRGTGAWAPIEE